MNTLLHSSGLSTLESTLHSNLRGKTLSNGTRIITSFMLFVLMGFYGIVEAQMVEPFTISIKDSEVLEDSEELNGKAYTCKQKYQKEGCRIEFTNNLTTFVEFGTTTEMQFLFFELDPDYANMIFEKVFPFGKNDADLLLRFESGTIVHKGVSVKRSGQTVNLSTNMNNFIDNKQNKIDAQTFLSTLAKDNIQGIEIEMVYDMGLWSWEWELNSFKTAPTIKAMIQKIANEMEKSNGMSTKPNSLSRGVWRTQMNKVMDHVPGWYFENMLYRGQEINVGYYVTASHGLGVNKWPDGTFYWGDWKNGDQHGYGIYICPDGYNVKNCSGCVYYVGNWYSDKKSGKGTCYDKYGNLIYYGDFSSNSPTGTYPSTGSFSSYKFECIEYDNGNKYVGETKDGKRHGYGIYLWKNGDAWYGPWKDGIRDGYGMNLYYNGNTTYGRWLNDTYYKY